MAELRKLANAGATVILLHHRAKTQESRYRGSSDILAGVDVAYVLEHDDGQLRLIRFKSRFSAEHTFRINADFAEGHFEAAEEHGVRSRHRDVVEGIQQLLTKEPGATQSRIVTVLAVQGIGRTQVRNVLREYVGHSWRVEEGPNRALLYYPMNDDQGVQSYKEGEQPNNPCTPSKDEAEQPRSLSVAAN